LTCASRFYEQVGARTDNTRCRHDREDPLEHAYLCPPCRTAGDRHCRLIPRTAPISTPVRTIETQVTHSGGHLLIEGVQLAARLGRWARWLAQVGQPARTRCPLLIVGRR